jgi:asparagine synthase (glutamine-hydrolysing)
MCGIGFVHAVGDPNLSLGLAYEIGKIQKGRGIDFQGVRRIDDYAICHQRLAIVDLNPRSNQPFALGATLLAFNGELYGYNALAAAMNLDASSSFSDTAVLAHYIDSGLFLNDLNVGGPELDGMYSCISINREENGILLFSDPFGIKQLFVLNLPGVFAVASTLSALKFVAHNLGCILTVDEETREWKEYFLGLPPGRTQFNEIIRLIPGEVIKYMPSSQSMSLLGVIPKRQRHVPNRHLLRLASPALMADVPVTILLSGGVDSSFLAYSAHECGIDVSSATVLGCQKSAQQDEKQLDSFYASEFAGKLGIKHYLIDSGLVDREVLIKVFDLLSCPSEVTGSVPLLFAVQWARERSIKVLLCGLGGDEMFLGYRAHRLAILSDILPAGISFLFSSVLALFGKVLSVFSSSDDNKLLARLEIMSSSLSCRWPSMLPSLIWCPQAQCSQALRVLQKYSPINNKIKASSNLSLYSTFLFRSFLADSHLLSVDQVSANLGVECRVPFLTRAFYGYSLNNCQAGIMDLIRPKQRLVDFLRGVASRRQLMMPKQGFGIDRPDYYSECARDFVSDLLNAGYQKGLLPGQARDYALALKSNKLKGRSFIHALNLAHYAYSVYGCA